MTVYCGIKTLDFFSDPHIKALPRDQQLAAMKFGCAVTYDDGTDEWREWTPDQIIDLYNYLRWCMQPVAGCNIIAFGWPVIIGNARRAGWKVLETKTMRFVDLFSEIRRTTGRWYKLEDVCQANLGRGKLADEQKAAEWLRSGDPELISKAMTYCRHDVELVVSLHGRLLDGEYLRLLPRSERGELNEIWWRPDAIEWVPDAMGVVAMK